MRKIIWTLIILVVVAIAAVLSIGLTMTPKDLKPVIAAEIQAKTGRQLTIDGDVHWQIWPKLRLSAKSLSLKDDPDFRQGELLSIGHMDVAVSPWGLFSHHLGLGEIEFSDVKVVWLRRSDGKNNLQSLLQDIRRASGHQGQIRSDWTFSAEGVRIKDARLDLIDHLKSTHATLSPMNLAFDGVSSNQEHHFKLDYHYKNGEKEFTSEAEGDLRIAQNWTRWMLSDFSQQFKFAGALAKEVQQATLSGGGSLDTQAHTLSVRPLSIAINGQAPVSGEVSVDLAKQPVQIDFNLVAGELKLPNGKFLLNQLSSYHSPLFAKGKASGQIKLDQLELGNLTLGNVLGSVSLDQGLLRISEVTADFYNGNLTANTSLQLDQHDPQFSLNLDLASVDSQLLYQQICNKAAPFSGTFRVSSQLTAMTPVTSAKSIEGRLQMNLNDFSWNSQSGWAPIHQLNSRSELKGDSIDIDSLSLETTQGVRYQGQGDWRYQDDKAQVKLNAAGQSEKTLTFGFSCQAPLLTLH